MGTAAQSTCEPECPRCGYDLAGETARWTDSCPIVSTCPECGLTVEWRIVFGPLNGVPRWSIEHPERGLGRGIFGVFFRSLRPRKFWDNIRMTSHARPIRLLAYAILGLMLVTFSMGVVEFTVELATQFGRQLSPNQTNALWLRGISVIFAPIGLLWWWPGSGPTPHVMWEMLLAPMFVVLCPLAYLALPTTLRRCRVRRVHLLRAFLLGAPMALLWAEVIFISQTLFFMARWQAGPGVVMNVLNFFEPILSSGANWIIVLYIVQWRWWHAVNRRYLRLPNPAGVTFAMLTIAGLATLTLLFAFTRLGVSLVELLRLA